MGWIGVDLDGTLAEYYGWNGPDHIGQVIPKMAERIFKHLSEGYDVKIFTVRASDPTHIPFVQEWLAKNGFPELEVTCCKDYQMILLYDDRCVQVIPNTGELVE